MSKKILKIVLVIVLSGFFVFSFRYAQAEDTGGCNINKTITGGKSGTQLNREDAKKAVTAVANILAGAAGTIALAFIVIGGIQLITAGGNQEQAGKAKNTLTWAVIGFILIIASYSIVSFFADLIQKGGA